MNNEDTPQAPQIDTVMQPVAPDPTPAFTPSNPMSPKQPRNGLKIALAAVLGMIVVLLIIGAYYLGTMAPTVNTANTYPKSNTTLKSTKNEEKVADPDTTPVADVYAGWQEYTNPAYGYSFKYPTEWLVSRKVIQDPYDWVSVSLPGEKNPGSNDIIAFHTYLDGTGCGQTVERKFTIGSEPATGRADCGDTRYTVMTKSSNGTRVAITINTAQGNDETVASLLKSVTGLTVVDK